MFAPIKALAAVGDTVADKDVWLFPAKNDELVPSSAVQDLKEKLTEAHANVRIVTLKGTHTALPGDGVAQNDAAMREFDEQFFA